MATIDLPAPSPTVIAKELADGAVLYCTATEVYFGVNEVGLAIWQAIAQEIDSLEELVFALRDRFPEATTETVRADAIEFLDALRANELVIPEETGLPAR